jgi:hypothetical protein
VKNEVGALATSIIYELKAFSIAEFGFIIQSDSRLDSLLSYFVNLPLVMGQKK